jgi:hypothetical protein
MVFHVLLFLLVFFLLSLALLWRLCWLPLQPSHSQVESRRTPLHRLRHRLAPLWTAPPVACAAPTRLWWDLH